ncbi:hypothetical protein BDV95DRAFT_581957 [Massariosphaeria phaeospora]|uniref:Blastomyces yeast-phase-specific protein n=1 Tax=Massariosphaeria phaeospora TaxID=100035 RepID=A0A7C8M3Q8_9PLEO|nr:hypothetical protein BDV95DRAFT_581957 [Massariosphaeria phaeospora]
MLSSTTTLLPLLSLLLPTTHALSHATITNHCLTPLTLSLSLTLSPPSLALPPSTSHRFPLHSTPASNDTTTTTTTLTLLTFSEPANASELVFAYRVDALRNEVWYDLASLFGGGDSAGGRKVVVRPSDAACEAVEWGGSGMSSGGRKCGGEADLMVVVCEGTCLPSWSPCGNAAPNDTRVCCTHCIGSHHCVAAPGGI